MIFFACSFMSTARRNIMAFDDVARQAAHGACDRLNSFVQRAFGGYTKASDVISKTFRVVI